MSSTKVLLSSKVLQPSSRVFVPRPARTPVCQRRKMSQVPTFGFTERKPSTEEDQMIQDVLKLYTLGETVDEAQPVDKLEPVSSAYARYAPDASFHDPIGIANGLEAVKAQFNSMPKLFSKSETKGVKVLDNPAVFALAQEYHVKFPPTTKLINSLITLEVDPSSNLIKHHEEEWDAKPNTTSDDGFFGKINEFRKKMTAEAVKAGADTRPVDQQN